MSWLYALVVLVTYKMSWLRTICFGYALVVLVTHWLPWLSTGYPGYLLVPVLTPARQIGDKLNGKEWYENHEMIDFQKQILLNKILQALHMNGRPPKVRNKINEDNFPSEIFSDTFGPLGVGGYEDRRGVEKNMQVILLADTITQEFNTVIQFKISRKYCRYQKILGAKLSVYVETNVESNVDTNNKKFNVIYTVINENVTVARGLAKNGWIHFDIKEAIERCSGNVLTFQISCAKCPRVAVSRKNRYKPYIAISIPDNKRSRTRRQGSCAQSSQCCRRSFYMNFTSIGWSDWIYKPKGFMANYCGGICYKPGQGASPTVTDAKPQCCVPTEKEGVTLFFIDGKTRMYYRKTIENVVVKKCGCA